MGPVSEPQPEPPPPPDPGPPPRPRPEPLPQSRSQIRNLTADWDVLPTQSRDDTDRGWGELPTRDDERFTRERPPHWE